MKPISSNRFLSALRTSMQLVVAPTVILAPAANLRAASLQWDADGVAPLGGSDTWDTGTARWFNGTTYQNWVNANNDDAVFDTAAGTVTLGEAITANSLTFGITGYTLAGAGNTLTLGSGNVTVTTSGQVAIINAALGGTSGLTKLGAGTVRVGTPAGYTGNTTVSAGTLGMGADNVFNASGLLDIATGARFNVFNGNGANSAGNEMLTQTFAGLTGSGTITFGQGPTNADRFKISLGTGDIRTFSGLVDNGYTGNNDRSAFEVSGAGTQVFSGTSAVGYHVLTIGAGSTVQVGSATALPTFSMDLGSATGKLDLNGFNAGINFAQTSTSEVTNSNVGQVSQLRHVEANQLRSVSQKITGNIQLLANVSTNTMFLTNTGNTFTGGLQLNAGAIRYNNAGSIPAATINFNGGRLEFGASNGGVFNADVASDRVYKVQAGTAGESGAFRSTTTAAVNPSQIILRGAIDNATGVTNPGILRFHGFGTGGQANNATYTLHGGGTYSGQLLLGENTTNNSGFTLRPGVANGLPTGAVLGFVGGPGTTQTLDLNGFSQELAGLTNTDTVTGYTARVITSSAAPAQVLTVNNAVDYTFAGKLGDTGANNNNFGLTKSGAGVLTIPGTHTYTGQTRVNGGVLALDTAYLDDASTLRIATGASVLLTHADEDVVESLVLNNVAQPDGLYTAATPGGFIAAGSTGSIRVITLGTSTPFEDFVAVIPDPSERDPEDDPDADGFSNLLEFVLGGDPVVSSQDIRPTQVIDGSNIVLSYTRTDDSELAPAATSVGQYSTDLINWVDVTPVLLNENGGAADDMTVTVAKANEVNGKLFVRIKVEM